MFADYVFDHVGRVYMPKLYKVLEYFGLETAAFSQLTRKYMREEFNPQTPDITSINYYSYGASLESMRLSIFRPSHNVIRELEGAPNDGFVSGPNSMRGTYKGTLVRVSHLDLIN